KTIRFCSSRETSPDHLDLIADQRREHAFLSALFAYVRADAAVWDTLEFEGISEQSLLITELHSQLNHGFLIDLFPSSVCPYLALQGTYRNYEKTFTPRKRSALTRKRKALLIREQAHYREIQHPDQIDAGMQQLFLLHAERASAKGIQTAFCGSDAYRFHQQLMKAYLPQKKVLLAFLDKGTTPLASYYCFRHNNKYSYYQTGISEAGERRSAGTVLLSLIIERAFEEGCTEFDFLQGDETYKKYWAKHARKTWTVTIYKDNPLERFRLGAGVFLRQAKSLLKRLSPLHAGGES
ncbi:MAG: GNAT family N-acetyltransferase, partial [Nitrospirota bacterium]